MGRRTRTKARLAQLFVTVAMVAWAASVYAQVPAAPPPGAPPPPPEAAPPGYPPPAPMAMPPPPPAPMAPPAESGPSDLDPSVRRVAIGYAGLSQVPVGSPAATDITVPAIGLRYWTSPTMGIDVALGFRWVGGSTEAAGTSTDKDSIFGFILQFGVPFALSTHRHVAFEVIPFAAVAHGQSNISAYMADVSGLRVDVGARAGFEVFFGFIGMPELALSATLGAQFELRKYSADMAGLSQSDTTIDFSTTVENNPWDIFTGAVSARYYF